MDKALNVSFPDVGLIAVTRGMIGVGAGLLLANTIAREKRRAIGLPLLIGGVLSTIPIAMHLLQNRNDIDKDESMEPEQETSH